MNILVFGGTRFMGKHLVSTLLEKGHSVTIATRGYTKDNFGNRVNRICLDRKNKESLQKNIPNIFYDVVYDHLAYCSNDIKCLLDTIQCKRYIQVSSSAVYENLHNNTKESEFDASKNKMFYCNRDEFPYFKTKQQAECAIVQDYAHISSVRVRFPFVIGKDDYTKRLYFYVEHIMKEKPMAIDNVNAQMAFVSSDEAGKFLAFLADCDFIGAINGANEQTISIAQIVKYVEEKTGKTMRLDDKGECGPYNGEKDYFLNLDLAKSLGFSFTSLLDLVYDVLDYYINQVRSEKV